MTRGQVRAMVRWESVIIALLGGILGLAVGVFFGWILVTALADEGIEVFALPGGQLAIFLVLAGLAGVLAGSITNLRPELGFELLLPIFAAVILGGIGDAFGALAAGLVLGVMTEWSTLLVDARWKITVGFIVLVIVLIIRPQGIFGKAKAV
jgi:branched-subunit amino acid ABC-type transport system permease component